jgi:hypothetical protein
LGRVAHAGGCRDIGWGNRQEVGGPPPRYPGITLCLGLPDQPFSPVSARARELGVGRAQLAAGSLQVIAAGPERLAGLSVTGFGAGDGGPAVAQPVGDLLLGQARLTPQRGEQVGKRLPKWCKLVRPVLV